MKNPDCITQGSIRRNNFSKYFQQKVIKYRKACSFKFVIRGVEGKFNNRDYQKLIK